MYNAAENVGGGDNENEPGVLELTHSFRGGLQAAHLIAWTAFCAENALILCNLANE